MAFKRRERDDYIGPSTGLMKWANKFFRFVLFPFIHPLFFIILLVVLGGSIVGIHHFANIGYREIPSWIITKNVNAWNNLVQKFDKDFMFSVSDNINKISSKVEDVAENIKSADIKSSTNNKIIRAVDRKAFKKVQNESVKVEITGEGKSIEDRKINSKSLFYFEHDNTSGLTYRKEPRIVKGSASVVNVNEININGENMLLYGIYSLPESQKGKNGALFLQNMIEGKEIECHIVAFTQNAELTAMCAVDGISINHKMVDLGYSKNINLR